jgi:hypothetical protein
VTFAREGSTVIAKVGASLNGWPDPIGPVVAIVETIRTVYVHVLPKPGAPAAFPILVSPETIIERSYFDDYPRR